MSSGPAPTVDPLDLLAPGGVLDLRALAATRAGQPAIVWRGQTVDYGQLAEAVAARVRELAGSGIRAGHRVAISGPPCPQWPVTLLGVLAVGALAVLLPHRQPAVERRRVLSNAAVDAHLECHPEQSVAADSDRAPIPIAVDQPATCVFTSGSTGEPRGVVHTLAAHLYSALGSAANIPFGAGDVWLVALPLHHVSGLSILFRALAGGGCVAIADSGSLAAADDQAVQLLAHCSHVSLVETQLRRVLEIPGWQRLTSRLRAALVGGSALSAALLRGARAAGLPVCSSYGCTEMASQVATTAPAAALPAALPAAPPAAPRSPVTPPDRPAPHTDNEDFAAAGTVLPHRRVRISQSGEILLGGKTLCAGVLRGTVIVPLGDADGYLASGDLGRLDAEQRLFVTGRRDAQFISGGENIQPEEIERVLLAHPAVRQALCVPVPDQRYGQRPVAFIDMQDWVPSATPVELAAPAELTALLDRHLSRFKHPDRYFSWPGASSQPDAPGTASGAAIKPRRSELTRLALGLVEHRGEHLR